MAWLSSCVRATCLFYACVAPVVNTTRLQHQHRLFKNWYPWQHLMAKAWGQRDTGRERGETWWGKREREKKESSLHKWCHQVAPWRAEWDRRALSCLFPRTQDEAPCSTVWPAGPGPAAMQKGTARADFDSVHHSRFFVPPLSLW